MCLSQVAPVKVNAMLLQSAQILEANHCVAMLHLAKISRKDADVPFASIGSATAISPLTEIE